ncbi:MAG: nicotinate-nucleotide--dimethylbenzimidazole phosphoribosyltransferase [Lachnospiraceae bacterium]|nr:nicotinate-nucleotide--dimethylbenzimidazole phosphoribosyltransferase [Lachnospiraceae bacterium]
MNTLEDVIKGILPIDRDAMEEAWKCWDSLCKPLRGLGWLEETLVQMAGIYRTPHPHPDKRAVVIMGADNGVVKEGVTQTDSSVTIQVLENMGDRLSTACVMCRLAGCELIPVNIGSLTDGKHPRIRNKVVRYGTDNIAEGSAMSREECIQAILIGVDTIREMKEEGYQLIVTGEMGIGNTTTSSACAAVLFDQEAEIVTGRGAGLSTAGLERKIQVIKRAIAVNQPDKQDPLDVITKVGGLDIAGMAGCYLGAAYYQMPILIDGFISAVSAYLAGMLCETAKEYMIATHCTTEPASCLVMEHLGKKAPLQAGMHLGEGTGAIMGLSLIDQALNVYYNLTTWDGAHVEAYTHQK